MALQQETSFLWGNATVLSKEQAPTAIAQVLLTRANVDTVIIQTICRKGMCPEKGWKNLLRAFIPPGWRTLNPLIILWMLLTPVTAYLSFWCYHIERK